MGGRPIGYQPLRAGLHRPWVGPRTVNINHKETTINNFGGGFFPYGGYGCYDPGLTKGQKWGIGLEVIAVVGGAVASAFLPSKTDGKGDVETPAQDGLSNEQKQWMDEMKEQTSQIQKSIEQLTEENTKLKRQVQEMQEIKAASERLQAEQHTGKVEKVPQEPKTVTFNVAAEKDGDQVKGHTGYNIVATMYKSPDGKPLTNAEIMGICNEIFDGKALPKGEIELPKEVEFQGKTYTWDTSIENPEEATPTSTYDLAQHDTYKSEVKQVGSKFIVIIDGETIIDPKTGEVKEFTDRQTAEDYKDSQLAELNKKDEES